MARACSSVTISTGTASPASSRVAWSRSSSDRSNRRNKMTWPEQIGELPKDRIACAPYNFVPLPEKVVTIVSAAELAACKDDKARNALLDDRLPSHDRFYPDRHTGYFDVTLTTKSPVYIRGLLTREQFARQGSDADKSASYREQIKNLSSFYHTGDANRPTIRQQPARNAAVTTGDRLLREGRTRFGEE